MGYYINQLNAKFRLPARNAAKAVRAACAAVAKYVMPLRKRSSGERLVELFGQWHWRMVVDPKTGAVTDIRFRGQKLLEEDALFSAIAPYVEAGSYISAIGSDLEIWRWYFDGECAVRQPGIVTFAVGKVGVENGSPEAEEVLRADRAA